MNYLEFILPSSIYSSNLKRHLMKLSQLFLWAKNLISIPTLVAIHSSLSIILMLCILNRLYQVNCQFVIYKNQNCVLKWLPVCVNACGNITQNWDQINVLASFKSTSMRLVSFAQICYSYLMAITKVAYSALQILFFQNDFYLFSI